jgi:hypothetical protein
MHEIGVEDPQEEEEPPEYSMNMAEPTEAAKTETIDEEHRRVKAEHDRAMDHAYGKVQEVYRICEEKNALVPRLVEAIAGIDMVWEYPCDRMHDCPLRKIPHIHTRHFDFLSPWRLGMTAIEAQQAQREAKARCKAWDCDATRFQEGEKSTHLHWPKNE